MKIINLDREFNPIGDLSHEIELEQFDFPSGCEPHVVLPKLNLALDEVVKITCRFRSVYHIIQLFLVTNALHQQGVKNIEVFIPFLPFARQDRVMKIGEPFSLKMLTDLINTMNYSKVILFDIHSDVAPALINNSEVISNYNFVSSVLKNKTDYLIISPDAGAYKKIFGLCKHLQIANGRLINCSKVRDIETGRILHYDVGNKHLIKGMDCYIVDDIGSKCGTFKILAQELIANGANSVHLVVSHWENTADVASLKDSGIATVYKTNSMNDVETKTGYIKNYRIKL